LILCPRIEMYNTSEKYNSITLIPQTEFADSIAAMYAPLEDYVSKAIPLMLEDAWNQKQINHSSALDQLLYNGWICRLITLDNRVLKREEQDEIVGWPAIRNGLVQCLDECKNESELPTMTGSCMEYIQPILRARFKKDYHFPKRAFHCWWYTIHDDAATVALHLVNAYQPESPFAHLEHFITTMLQAVEHAVAIYPTVKLVICGSWLNGLRKFQALWPESFRKSQKILNESGGFGPGAWGQYMNNSGNFHEEKAAILRRTGKHPFPLTEGGSPVDEVIAHLRETILSISKSRHE
jgi:hypothetical protein